MNLRFRPGAGAARLFLALGVIAALTGCRARSLLLRAPPRPDAHEYARRLGRGVNLGNALEAPNEGEWSVTIRSEYFALIRQAGFDSVRIPIRWSAHADTAPPYTIAEPFLQRVDEVVAAALAEGLAVVINIHHYEEIMKDPSSHLPRFLALWRQIAARYRNQPDTLSFELLNEPTDKLTAARWNDFLAQGIRAIRETNPGRVLIVGTAEWGGLRALPALELPEDDRHLVVTFHYYEPFAFTHQGAEWVNNSDPWLGTTWEGSPAQQQAVAADLDRAAEWAAVRNRPLYMGEFGAYRKADMESRVRWTAFVARAAEARWISWAYWEFCSGFGAYDADGGSWRQPLLDALNPR